ncbi:hypothetical protein BaOVIS_012730 [Babesia ovis]|uniref:Mitochondrial carrier protein n=1 Tax=Babesia ovis TaxID=5869 RepID=A0A9W5T9B5_BABOV|nr:hypothetical protein BaOVIS_012730 [Babesia ovis]
MINIANERFEQLKQNLLKLNIKKRKKRVGEARMHLTQYLAHVLPLASQRLLLAPIYRSCVAYQGANQAFYSALKLSHPSPFSILGEHLELVAPGPVEGYMLHNYLSKSSRRIKYANSAYSHNILGLYDSIGFRKLWSLCRVHMLSGAIFPAVLICTKSASGQTIYPRSNDSLGSGYTGTAMLCSFAHLFSYPFDVAYGRLASTLSTNVSLKTYFYQTYTDHGFYRLYSGYSLCFASTVLHLLTALSLNEHLQGKLKDRLSYQIERSPVYRSTIRPLEPAELKPIEMFPWNIIFGSIAAFAARTVTYPLDTLRVRYQQESWHHNGRTTFRELKSSISKLGVRYISLWRPFSKPPTKSDYGQSDLELYSKTKPETSLVTRFWQGIKRVARIEEGDPDEQITEYFQYSVERLMLHPGEFTFEKFAMYLEDICTKLRIIGKRPISDNDLSAPLKQLKLQYEMMKYLSPREKESDSATVFSHQAKVLLAEAVKGTLKDVDDMLLHHDICKTDRTWYFRRIVLGRHLPTSYEEREHLSYQRPVVREASQLFPETQSFEAARLKKMRDDVHYRKIPYVIFICSSYFVVPEHGLGTVTLRAVRISGVLVSTQNVDQIRGHKCSGLKSTRPSDCITSDAVPIFTAMPLICGCNLSRFICANCGIIG